MGMAPRILADVFLIYGTKASPQHFAFCLAMTFQYISDMGSKKSYSKTCVC